MSAEDENVRPSPPRTTTGSTRTQVDAPSFGRSASQLHSDDTAYATDGPPGSAGGAPTDDTVDPSVPPPDRTLAFAPGDRVQDHYVVEGHVASGGMGQVFRARDTVLDRPVALKALDPSLRQRMRSDERALGEARALSRLQHPNIVQIYGFGATDDFWYIVMELVEGESLADRLVHPLEVAEAAHVVAQMGAALTHAHNRGIVHGDVKPRNVLITRVDADRLFVKVVDFGLARVATDPNDPTPQGPVGGTPRYMAPEQIAGARPDPRMDVYALGLIAFELLARTHPFGDRDVASMLIAHRTERPPLVSDVAPERHKLGRRVDLVLQKALAKDPRERFERTDELASALLEALTADGSLARSTEASARRALTRSRHDGGAAPAPWRDVTVLCAETVVLHGSGRALYRGEQWAVWDAITTRVVQLLTRLDGVAVHLTSGRIVALFGLGADPTAGAEAAIKASLALHAVLADLLRDPTLGVDARVALRVGIEHGTALVANPDQPALGVLDGPPVRRAQALAQAALDNEVLAGASAFRLLRGTVEAEARPALSAWAVLQRRPKGAVFTFAAKGTPFVGRSAELGQLRSAYALSTSGAQVAVLIGEAGTGKSRLALELVASLQDGAPPAYAHGRSSPDGSGAPLEPFAEMVARAIGGLGADDADPVALLASALGRGDAAAWPEARLVARVLGLIESDVKDISPPEAHERGMVVQALADLLRRRAAPSGLIVHLDDFQWARPATLDLFRRLIAALRDAPILFCLGLRPGLGRWQPTEIALDRLHLVQLRPLEGADVDALVTEVLGEERAASAEDLDAIRVSSGGVPGHVEAFADALRTGGDVDLRRTAEELLLDRLAALPSLEVEVLERLSVAGTVGWAGLGDADGTIGPEVWVGPRAQRFVVDERPSRIPNEQQLVFRNALVRDAIYRHLDPRWRTERHHATAEWLESRSGRSVGWVEDLVLHHWVQCAQWDKAASAALRAGHRALEGLAGEEAATLFSKAVEYAHKVSGALLDAGGDERSASPTVRTLREGYLACALAANVASRPEEGFIWLDRAVADPVASLGPGGVAFSARLLARRADLCEVLGQGDEALVLLERAAGVSIGGPDSRLARISVVARRAMILARRGRPKDARAVAEEALAWGEGLVPPSEPGPERVEWHRGLGTLHGALGHALTALGDFAGGERHYAASQVHWDETGQLAARATALLNLGASAWWQGQREAARERWGLALDLYRRGGAFQGVAWCLVNLAELHVLEGQPETAIAYTTEARELLAAVGTRDYVEEALRVEAEALIAAGRPTLSEAPAREALALARASGNRAQEGATLRTLGRALAAVGKPKESAEVLEEAATVFDAAGLSSEAVATRALMARPGEMRDGKPIEHEHEHEHEHERGEPKNNAAETGGDRP